MIFCYAFGSFFFLSYVIVIIVYLSSLILLIFLHFQKNVVNFNLRLPTKDGSHSEDQTEQVLGLKEMAIPIFAGILSALRRVIARRVSLKVLSNIQITL